MKASFPFQSQATHHPWVGTFVGSKAAVKKSLVRLRIPQDALKSKLLEAEHDAVMSQQQQALMAKLRRKHELGLFWLEPSKTPLRKIHWRSLCGKIPWLTLEEYGFRFVVASSAHSHASPSESSSPLSPKITNKLSLTQDKNWMNWLITKCDSRVWMHGILLT